MISIIQKFSSFRSDLRVKVFKTILVFVTIGTLIGGCAPFASKEQSARGVDFQLIQDSTLGQSFLSRYDGLSGISILVTPDQIGDRILRLDLYDEFGGKSPIRSTKLMLAASREPTYLTFEFAPIKDSTNQDYYFEITNEGSGTFTVAGDAGNKYLHGVLYADRQPQNSQLAFTLEFSLVSLILGLIVETFNWFGIFAAGIFIISIPGWTLLDRFFPPWRELNWIGKFSLSLGVGLACYPLIFLWFDVISIPIGPLFAWLFPLICLVVLLVGPIRNYFGPNQKRNDSSSPGEQTSQKFSRPKFWQKKNFLANSLPDIAFIAFILFVFISRFWPVRTFDAAMWGDSYQHTLIAQLLVENGGLFKSWQPYTELSSFTYHFGFHTIAVLYHWLFNIEIAQAVLWIGQLLNIFAIISLYPLGVIVGKNRWAGVIAVLVAGLISLMPMSYTNWGRFTQLAGQVILPALTVILLMNLPVKRSRWKWYALIWITAAGLFLSHYRVMLFLLFFYISYLLIASFKIGAVNIIKKAAIHGIGIILLLLPWLVRLFEGRLPEIYSNQLQIPASQVSQAIQEYNVIWDITGFLPIYIWVLMALSIIWGIFRRNQYSNIISLWWVLIFLVANPGWFNLPGAGILSNFAILIASYIPAAVLVGSSLGSILTDYGLKSKNDDIWSAPAEPGTADSRRFNIISLSTTIILLSIGLIGIRNEIILIKPSLHMLLTRPDVRAGQWIDDNLPVEAKFLVNSFFAYGGSLVVGSDAGWWLPLSANRSSVLPPINYGTEKSEDPEFLQQTNELYSSIYELGISHPDNLDLLSQLNVTHVYIGQQRGKVNASEPPILIARELLNDPNFRLIYNQDRILIFELVTPDG